MSERSIAVLLDDILESIDNILTFTLHLTFEQYSNDIKTIHAVHHNFMIIGEAVARIPEEFRLAHNQVNWKQVKGFRNVIVHDYFGIDNTIVWDIIHQNIPELHNQITDLSNALDQ